MLLRFYFKGNHVYIFEGVKSFYGFGTMWHFVNKTVFVAIPRDLWTMLRNIQSKIYIDFKIFLTVLLLFFILYEKYNWLVDFE